MAERRTRILSELAATGRLAAMCFRFKLSHDFYAEHFLFSAMYVILLALTSCALAITPSSSVGSIGPNQTSFNGSVFQWKLQDVYGGPTFFE